MNTDMGQTQVETVALTLLAVITALACLVRFSFQYPDSQYYMEMVGFFRGEVSASELNAPFAYRPLLPFIAAILPFAPQITISFLNLCFIVLLSWVYFLIAKEYEVSILIAFLTSAIYSVSWVVMYYGAVVLVDPGAILCLSLAFLMMIRNKERWKIGLVLLIGVFIKEIALIGIASYLLLQRDFSPAVLVPAPLGYAVVRFITPVSNPGFLWHFHFRAFTDLFSSTMKTLLVALVPYLVLIAIGLLYERKNNNQSKGSQQYLISTAVPAVVFLGVGLFFAHFDARFVWPLYPSLVPTTVYAVDSIAKLLKKHLTSVWPK